MRRHGDVGGAWSATQTVFREIAPHPNGPTLIGSGAQGFGEPLGRIGAKHLHGNIYYDWLRRPVRTNRKPNRYSNA